MRAKQLITSVAICSVAIAQSSSAITAHSERVDSAATASHSGNPRKGSKLLKHDRLRLVEAQAQGKKEVTLLIASVEGANESLLRMVTDLGGSLCYRDDDVSYLRVKLPTENVEKLARSADIESLNIDGLIDYLNSPSPEPSPAAPVPNQISPPDRNTPAENPYLPSRELGAPQFIAQHPTFDGRGVTIAIVDTSIDILSPELQTAKTLDGQPTPKIADVLTAERDAIVPNYDNGRLSGYVVINMETQVTAHDGKLTYQGVTYTVPAQETFRIGILDERMGDPKDDLNRDGNPAGSSRLFGILWDEKTNTVWVDTNQDHSFIDEKPMTDYHVKNDIGIFGKDDPTTLIRETVGFTVQTDTAHKVVYIVPGYGEHGTQVAGVAAGKNFFGGQISGVAPEAQILSVPFGGRRQRIMASEIESIILAVKHPQVDLVSVQIGLVMPLNDGRSTISIVCNRLIEKYKKLIFLGAGNSLGDEVNSISDGAAAGRTIAAGSYINKKTARTNYGVATSREDNIDAVSARGPSKSGAFKPNILAPSVSLSTKPGFLPGDTYSGTYDLPPGYRVGGGTSTSTPMAAAGAALLISAAKQSNVKYDADRLRWAIMSSARYLPGYGAHEQGAGCFQVGEAWKALTNAPKPIEIISRAPVAAALSQYLHEPNRGVGIFEREGWSAGQSGKREIVFTRTSGGQSPMRFALRWQGNDGTFSAPAVITLPLDAPVTIPIAITTKTAGAHSAILNLDVPGGPRAVYQVLNTIVAADQFSPTAEFTVTKQAQADWMSQASWYLNVPAGTKALKLDVKIANGNVIPYLIRPSGAFFWPLAQRPLPPTGYQGSGSWSRSISRPDTGVWQLVVANKNINVETRLAKGSRAIFTMRATILSAKAAQAVEPLEFSPTHPNYFREVTFTNQLSPFFGGVADSSLGSAFSDTMTMDSNSAPRTFEINIPPGARTVNARIAAGAEGAADLDLYLFDCTQEICKLKDFSASDGMDEEVEVENPAAGRWKIVVDPFLVPEKVKYSYFDFFTHAAFGAIQSTSETSLHPTGATWTERVSIKVDAAPAGSRYLAGFMAVMAEADRDVNKNGATTPGQQSPDFANVALGMTEISIRKTEKAARGSPGSRE